MQHLASFFVQSVENMDQGAFHGQRIEATQIGRDGRGETGNFMLVKLGQQQITTFLAQSKDDTGAVTHMCLNFDAFRAYHEIIPSNYCTFCA